MGKVRYKVHLNYEDCIRITGTDNNGLMIHDERVVDMDEQRNTLVELSELVAGDESHLLLKTLGYMYDNFKLKSLEIEV